MAVSQTGCRHGATSLVEMDSKNGPFISVQCDMCGAVLPQVPIDEATYNAWECGALKVARMDFLAYCGAVDRAWRDVLADDAAGLGMFVKVARG